MYNLAKIDNRKRLPAMANWKKAKSVLLLSFELFRTLLSPPKVMN